MEDTSDDLVPITVACQLIGGRETPITPSTLYKGIKSGRFPAPLKLGPGTSRWRRSEIMAVLDRASAARQPEAA
ncbi:AlpA family phage regulatory protein [Mesorhizobium waimense]|uniref:AlpA family phage regulatory protein n=1 Tax=Mesorhizobium waimense TaxID=1300307 RepID=A0A3A5K5Y3_9HYPH|nr:AlpA family phage regulatory protein [Mesorhizobium waimense]RJT28132.1 AlpA family phage regulatory protein [Mesorhizobium waimense]